MISTLNRYQASLRQFKPDVNVSRFKCAAIIFAALGFMSQITQADIGATHTALVSEFASFNTPGVVDGKVAAIAIDGDNVFVGGTFTQIHDPLSNEIIDQSYLFAYSKSTGNIIREFDPVLNLEVTALETTGDGTGIFAGGIFNLVNGVSNGRGLAKLDMNGDRVSGFSARPNALVTSLVRLDNTLYVGGNFSTISGTSIENLAAIDTTSGAVLPQINLDFDGVISTERTNGVQGIDDIDITSDGRLMVIFGNFSTIDGISRHRLALLELEGQAKVSTWNTDMYDTQCHALFPVQIRGVDIAPDDSYFITGSSGARRKLDPACDTLLRFEIDDLTNTDAQPTWINFTGGDSIFEVVTTDHAIYMGGHFRWLDNFNSDNAHDAGEGSTERFGLAAIDPLNGLTLRNWRSDRNPRGVGTFALIAEPEGLYIGDDTDFLNGTEHKKIKFLPISNDVIARPDQPTLPTTLFTSNADALEGISFDGNSFGTASELRNSDWANSRGGIFVGGQLFHADNNGTLWMSQFSDGVLENRVPVDLFGLTEEQWMLSQLGGMFFDYDQSRVYYTIQGDSRLLYRAFTPDGTFFGDIESIADQQADIPWGDVSGMDVIDGHLYFARNDGALYRAEIDGAAAISGTTELISGPTVDGRNWNNNLLAFFGEGQVVGGGAANAQIEFESSGDSAGAGRFRRFEFSVTSGEPVVLRLEWLNSDAELRLFVRDSDGELLASDVTAAGSPKFLTIPAGDGGIYTASVLVAESSTSYTLAVNPQEAPPAPLADFEFASSGSADVRSWQVFDFDVEAGELVEAQVIWDDPTAQVNMFLRNESNASVARDTDGSGSPAMASIIASSSGTWSVGVKVKNGDVNYAVLVDTTRNNNPTALAITNHPVNVTVTEGENATFSVTATGSGTISYQWYANGVVIAGASNNTLTLNTLTLEDSGIVYTVNVTDDNSNVFSNGATLTVEHDATDNENPVAITNQPADVTVAEGGNAVFTVNATGSGTISYQWFADGTAIAGASNNTLTLNSVTLEDSGTTYTVNVTDDNGTVVSNGATLEVESTPTDVSNIALTGNASQSSTGFKGVPERAIDGNTSGVYSQRSTTHTKDSNQPWWQVELTKSSTIDTIVLYNRTDSCCSSRLTNYTVSILDDNGTTVYSQVFIDAPDPANFIAIGGIDGRTVRVQLNSSGALSLAEVQVMGYTQ